MLLHPERLVLLEEHRLQALGLRFLLQLGAFRHRSAELVYPPYGVVQRVRLLRLLRLDDVLYVKLDVLLVQVIGQLRVLQILHNLLHHLYAISYLHLLLRVLLPLHLKALHVFFLLLHLLKLFQRLYVCELWFFVGGFVSYILVHYSYSLK